jgi:hypothetical protein
MISWEDMLPLTHYWANQVCVGVFLLFVFIVFVLQYFGCNHLCWEETTRMFRLLDQFYSISKVLESYLQLLMSRCTSQSCISSVANMVPRLVGSYPPVKVE